MKITKKIWTLMFPMLLLSGAVFAFVPAAQADKHVDVREQFKKALSGGGLIQGEEAKVPEVTDTINIVVSSILALSGIAIFILIIYAGFMWAFAAGNAEKVKRAQGILISGVIGLIIIFSAYAIANFVLTAISGTAGGT